MKKFVAAMYALGCIMIAGAAITGCNSRHEGQDVVGPTMTQAVRATKVTLQADPLLLRAVVHATVTRDGEPVGNVEVSLSRSISGRAPDYRWKAQAGADGKADVQIDSNGPVNGFYLCRAVDATSGEHIGNWGSMPINGGQEISLSLPVGGPVDITGTAPLATPPPPSAAPAPATQAVLGQIEGYSTWAQWPEGAGKKESASHGGVFVETYYNQVVGDFMTSGAALPLPAGSIIVKENYPSPTAASPAALTVMSKSENGNWYWIKGTTNGRVLLGPDGETPIEGETVSSCISCHTSSAPAGNDLVVTHTFAPPPPSAAPAPATQAVLGQIEGYSTWAQWPEGAGKKESASHGGVFVETYYNQVVGDFMTSGAALPLPAGSIIVKENYPSPTAASPAALTVMSKSENGNWYWIKGTTNGRVLLGPDGETPIEGETVSSCISCHTSSAPAGNDLVVTHTFAPPPPSAAPASATQAVLGQIEGYSTWAQWPEGAGKKESASHGGVFVETYYNQVVGDFMTSGAALPLPAGSIIVKENYPSPTAASPAALTVMSKSENGNWYWIKGTTNGRVLLGPDGETPIEGETVSSCINCHTSSAPAGNDLVVTHTFSQ